MKIQIGPITMLEGTPEEIMDFFVLQLGKQKVKAIVTECFMRKFGRLKAEDAKKDIVR
jgi:hypothetical protein